MAGNSAHVIAEFFLAKAPAPGISNLKLQKLLYYAQAWHLALYGDSLFPEKIEAWIHGPVVPGVFRKYKTHHWNPIPGPGQIPSLAPPVRRHLEEVLRVYGKLEAVVLERMTHRESPWRDVRAGLAPDEPSNRVITHEAMRKFYSARLHA